MSRRKLVVEVNANAPGNRTGVMGEGNRLVMVTPPISAGYWTHRVQVSAKQAVVAFPKFTTVGIGFQHEDDWNTNLPYLCSAEEIYEHIKRNRRGARKDTCIAAIRLLQEEVAKTRVEDPALVERFKSLKVADVKAQVRSARKAVRS